VHVRRDASLDIRRTRVTTANLPSQGGKSDHTTIAALLMVTIWIGVD